MGPRSKHVTQSAPTDLKITRKRWWRVSRHTSTHPVKHRPVQKATQNPSLCVGHVLHHDDLFPPLSPRYPDGIPVANVNTVPRPSIEYGHSITSHLPASDTSLVQFAVLPLAWPDHWGFVSGSRVSHPQFRCSGTTKESLSGRGANAD
jgi:hypothetical protein